MIEKLKETLDKLDIMLYYHLRIRKLQLAYYNFIVIKDDYMMEMSDYYDFEFKPYIKALLHSLRESVTKRRKK